MDRNEFASMITLLETIYRGLSKEHIEEKEYIQMVNVLSIAIEKVRSFYQNDDTLKRLQRFIEEPLAIKINSRFKLLELLEQFELSLLKQKRFHLYFHHCNEKDIPIHDQNISSYNASPVLCNRGNHNDLPVLIYDGHPAESDALNSSFQFPVSKIIELEQFYADKMKNLDYFTYDRLYLDSKLLSLKERQDIKLLLAGSSYTMCGLFENDMPLPARNIAVDAQDIYYSLKSIRKSLEHNPNISHIVLSFAYYLWGVDLSSSNSIYNMKRISEVNYPIFKDKHHFKDSLDERIGEPSDGLSPLQKHLFYGNWIERSMKEIKRELADRHYFAYARLYSDMHTRDDETNNLLSASFTEGHNKFHRYEETVKENIQLFEEFLKDMKERNIQVLVYVPPATHYYQKHTSIESIQSYNKLMKPLQEKHRFQFIDLFDSPEFTLDDFYDFDHLNDQGARKLGEIISVALKH